ncbi:MAG: AAA-like domain-containing protein, partial [Bacteroidales bacterium]|nr:AAA-like domain-containing protein [Bacteroidales bacterium]
MDKPFIFGEATSGKQFTDRDDDAKRLSDNFLYGVNTIIISPRRWGKTSLVLKVIEQNRDKQVRIVHFDA